MDYKQLTAACGMDCFNCEVYEKNLTAHTIQIFSQKLNLPAEKLACKGCKPSGGCRLHWGNCDTLDCVKTKGLAFCYECPDFPCVKLQPCADGADRLPHNYKVYNLCRIKNIGIDTWAREAGEIRKRYFKGVMTIGAGPSIKE